MSSYIWDPYGLVAARVRGGIWDGLADRSAAAGYRILGVPDQITDEHLNALQALVDAVEPPVERKP